VTPGAAPDLHTHAPPGLPAPVTASTAAVPPPPQAAAMRFIMMVVLIDMLAVGIIVPVLPMMVGRFTTDPAEQSAWYGVVTLSYALAQFVGAPLLGALSDRFGRRPVLLLGFFGLAINFFTTALATSIAMLVASRVIGGVMQANAAVANAYVADITPAEQRARRFGLIGAMFGIGFILGPVLGGLLGGIDLRLPFFVAGGLALLNLAYGWFVLPESLPREQRRRFTLANANPLGSLRLLGATPELRRLSAMSFLFSLAQYALNSVFVLYAGYRYGWSTTEVGFALMLVGVCSGIVQAGLLKHLRKRYDERQLLVAGTLCGVLGFVMLGASSAGWGFLLAVPLNSLWGLAGPSGLALITQRTAGDMHGRVQGGLASLSGIAGLVGPLAFTSVFGFCIAADTPLQLPGAPFLLAAGIVAAGLVLALPVLRRGVIHAKTEP